MTRSSVLDHRYSGEPVYENHGQLRRSVNRQVATYRAGVVAAADRPGARAVAPEIRGAQMALPFGEPTASASPADDRMLAVLDMQQELLARSIRRVTASCAAWRVPARR